MASSLSNLVNNLSEEIHKIKCKYRHDNKNCETCRIKYKYCGCFLEYANFKDDLIEHKYSLTMITISLLRKDVYPYEYMDDWKKSNKTSLPEKEDFHSHLNMEDITVQIMRTQEEFVKNSK